MNIIQIPSDHKMFNEEFEGSLNILFMMNLHSCIQKAIT